MRLAPGVKRPLPLHCCPDALALAHACRLYLATYHLGLFLTLTLGQIGVQVSLTELGMVDLPAARTAPCRYPSAAAPCRVSLLAAL